MSDDRTITMFTGAGGDVGPLGGERQVELPVATLRKNLEELVDALRDMLPAVDASVPGMGLKAVSVAVAVNGKAQVGFLGTGVEAGGQATLTLTFERG